MDRIFHPTASASPPTVDAHPTSGFPTPGNPLASVPATVFTAWVAHMLIEELRGIVSGAGITPDKANVTQAQFAVRRMAAANVTTHSATGALTADQAGVILATAAGGNVTLTLPAATAASGRPLRFHIVRTDTSANTLTIARAGSDTIEGLTSFTVPTRGRVVIVSDGTSAWRLGHPQRPFGGAQLFTAGGTFTVPANVFRLQVRVWGGGGGGSGGGGASGSAGGYSLAHVEVDPGQAITVTVGGGGSGANDAATAGNGGTSSFGSFASATGGTGSGAAAGAAGTGSGGTINLSGGLGQDLDGNLSSARGALPPDWMGYGAGGNATGISSGSGTGSAGQGGAVMVEW